MGRKATGTDLDAVLTYLQRKERHLTDKQREILDRISLADDIMRQHGPGKNAKNMIAEKLGISDARAYQAMRDAQYVFGTTMRAEKEWTRGAMLEKLWGILSKVLAALDEAKAPDPKLFSAATSVFAEIRKTAGYDREELDLPDFGEIGPHHYEIVMDPEVLGLTKVENREEIFRQIMNLNGVETTDAQILDNGEPPEDLPE